MTLQVSSQTDVIKNLSVDAEKLETIRSLTVAANVTKYVAPATIGVLLLIGLVGNVLVIAVTTTTRRISKHPVHSILVLNLAVTDIIYLLASAPYQAMYNSVSGWIYGGFFCPFLHYINIQTMAVSIFTMCSLATMRFLALMTPFIIRKIYAMTSEKLVGCLIVAVVWTLASAIALPNAVHFRVKIVGQGMLECAWKNIYADTVNSIILLIFTYIVPFLLVSVLYVTISKKLLCGMEKKHDRFDYIKTTIMVFCLIFAFLLCWFPHHLFTMILVSKNYSDDSYAIMRHVIEVIGYCCAYAHGCVNPIIYTFASPGFRRSLRLSLRRGPSVSNNANSCIMRRLEAATNGGSPIKILKKCDQSKEFTMITKLTPTLIQSVISSPVVSKELESTPKVR